MPFVRNKILAYGSASDTQGPGIRTVRTMSDTTAAVVNAIEHAFVASHAITGTRYGFIAVDTSQLHPCPVVISFGDNLADLAEFLDRIGVHNIPKTVIASMNKSK